MTKLKDLLWWADQLARFANAKGENNINIFRENNHDFFPAELWDNPSLTIEWVNSGDEGVFDPLEMEVYGPSGRLKSSGGTVRVHSPADLQNLLRLAWESRFTTEWCVLLLAFAQAGQNKLCFPPCGFQNAVMFLAMESWRARFCSVCGGHFAAEKPATRFCSNACAARARRDSRNASWKKHGKKWRKGTARKLGSRKA